MQPKPKTNKILPILWTDPDCKGYTDLLPMEIFAREGVMKLLTHTVTGPDGRLYQSRCRVIVKERIVDLNYEPLADFTAIIRIIRKTGCCFVMICMHLLTLVF